MRTLVDRDSVRVHWTEVDGVRYTLSGECLKCGTCCARARRDCSLLRAEVWDGIAVRICTDYWNRPWYCAYFPFNPHDVLPENCGFKWERVLNDN